MDVDLHMTLGWLDEVLCVYKIALWNLSVPIDGEGKSVFDS